MAFTLTGRFESRLAAAILPALAAVAIASVVHEWWPLELVGLMLGIGLCFDLAYYRFLTYQPGWLAAPLGLLELVAVMALVRGLGVEAPFAAALTLFAGGWLLAQGLSHAVLPLVHISYAEDGGELGRAGVVVAAACIALASGAGGLAWAKLPPTITLPAGVHRGPLVLDTSQRLVGEPGAVVEGGIVIVADDVTVKGVTVIGGQHGIEVDGAIDVTLDDVRVSGSSIDGINVRRSEVTIRDCVVQSSGRYAQGIDVSAGFDLAPSTVEGCLVHGGQEGIVSHFAHVRLVRNTVTGTSLRGITVTEMSMGSIERNEVRGALGVGIFCGDYSECEIEKNAVSDIRADHVSGDRTRLGFAIVSHYGAEARVADNDLAHNGAGIAAFIDATVVADED
jgi:hypothetical protein